MMNFRLRWGVVFAGAIALLMSIPAAAQERSGLGGVKLGVLTIFPTLTVSARYNDNIYFVPTDTEDRSRLDTEDKESDFIINVTPDVLFDITAGTFNFQLGYNFYGDIYTGFDDTEKKHDELNAINHSGRARLAYTAPVGFFFEIKDLFRYQETFTTSDEFVDFLLGDQIHNDGKFTIGYKRPPQDSILVALSYRNLYDKYRKDDFDRYDRQGHLVGTDFRLKFFPRTAFVVEGVGGLIQSPNDEDFQVLLYYGLAGVVGQITNHIQIKAKGGFGVWDYQILEDYRNFLAQGEFALVWEPTIRVAVGYERRVVDATDTNFRATDEVYLEYNHAFVNRFYLSLRGAYAWNDFSKPYNRDEEFLQGNLEFTTRILYWFYIGAGYNLERKLVQPGENDEYDVIRHIGMLKLTAKF